MDAQDLQHKAERELHRVEGALDAAGTQLSKDSKARTALVYFITMLFVFAIILLVVSGYAATQFTGSSWVSLLGEGLSLVGVAAGVLCLISASFGCCATQRQNRVLLCCSLLFSFVFLFVQIAAIAITIRFSFTLTLGSVPSSQLTSLGDVAANNALLSAWVKCCTGCPNGACNNPTPGSYFNGTLPFCAPPLNQCTFVGRCTQPNQANCFVFTPEYTQRVSGSQVIPPVFIPDNVCTTLSRIASHGERIVGMAALGNCGHGKPSEFGTLIAAYLESVLGTVAVVYVIVAIVQGMICGLSLYIICRPCISGKSGFEDEMPPAEVGMGEDAARSDADGERGSLKAVQPVGSASSGSGAGAGAGAGAAGKRSPEDEMVIV